MKTLIRVLTFLRLVNGDDNVSLTNIALIVGIVAFYRHPGTVEIGGLVAAIAMYQTKKLIVAPAAQAQVETDTAQRDARVAAVEKVVAAVAEDVKQIRNGQAWAGVLKR